MPENRAIPLPTALLVATAAIACSIAVACAFLLVALVLVSGHAAVALHDGAWAAWCGAAAGACGTVAALIALTRAAGGLRPLALGAAWALAFAWPLTGAPPAAAIAATLATGFVVRWGATTAHTTHDPAPVAAVLAAAALALLTAAFGGAPGTARVGSPDEARADTGAIRESAPRVRDDAREGRPSDQPARTNEPPGSSEQPARVVFAYYRALDRRDFPRAWRVLSPAVQGQFGGFERWRAGFGATLSSRPSALRVTAADDEAAVEHVLTARDSAACGVLVQRFSVGWRLRRTPDGWRAVALSAEAIGARCS